MIDTDSIGPPSDPRPRPKAPARPQPPPAPARPEVRYLTSPAAPHWLIPVLFFAVAVLVVVLVAMLLRPVPSPDTPTPSPAPADGVKLGRAFAEPAIAALAEGFEAEADALHAGKSAADADAAMKARFRDSLDSAFAKGPAPAFAAVVPAGKDPADDAERARFERLHRDFAKGLREGVR